MKSVLFDVLHVCILKNKQTKNTKIIMVYGGHVEFKDQIKTLSLSMMT